MEDIGKRKSSLATTIINQKGDGVGDDIADGGGVVDSVR
jgi:hypothetical protein